MAVMTEADPTLTSIAARFPDLYVAKSRGGYTLIDPASDTPLARLKPIPQTDRFELFYWSLGNVGAPSETSGVSALRSTELTRSSAMKPSSTSREAGETTRFFDKVELSQ